MIRRVGDLLVCTAVLVVVGWASVADAQSADQLAALLFSPEQFAADRFIYGEITSPGHGRVSIVKKMEFTKKNGILSLFNPSDNESKVDIHVQVLNKYGISVWEKHLTWISKLKGGDSWTETWAFKPERPDSMGFSNLGDPTPAYVVVW